MKNEEFNATEVFDSREQFLYAQEIIRIFKGHYVIEDKSIKEGDKRWRRST